MGSVPRAELSCPSWRSIAEATRQPCYLLLPPATSSAPLSRLPPRTKAICHENAQARSPCPSRDVASARRKVSEGRLAGLGEAHICQPHSWYSSHRSRTTQDAPGGGKAGVGWGGGGWEGAASPLPPPLPSPPRIPSWSEMQISGGLMLGVPGQMADSGLALCFLSSCVTFCPRGPGHLRGREVSELCPPTAAP